MKILLAAWLTLSPALALAAAAAPAPVQETVAPRAPAPVNAAPAKPKTAEDRVELQNKIKRDLVKVDRSIAVTENLIAQSRTAPYLPDLIFRLAELFVEKGRYRFFLENENLIGQGKSGSAIIPEVTLLGEKAISLYDRILHEYPDFKDSDKVRFFIAHQQRDLGRMDKALTAYNDLVDKHPKSPLAAEALLIIGDYWFDKSDLDKAEAAYLKILERPQSPVHDLARYKEGWVWINRGKHAEAVKYFEAAARSPLLEGADAKALSVKSLALSDLVYSYTEARPAKGAIEYFEGLSDSVNTFATALEKLGNRYFIKQDFEYAARSYRKLLTLSRDPERDPDRAQRLHETLKAGKVVPRADDVRAIVRVAARARVDLRMTEEDRARVLEDFEVYARDLSTSLQLEAQKKDDRKLASEAADAYEAYLGLFRNEKNRLTIQKNRADTLFLAQRFAEAGKAFELVAKDAKGDEQDEPLFSAIASYNTALLTPDRLSYFERSDSRSAVKQLGAFYVKTFPGSKHAPKVKFNVARAYYDEGEFKQSGELFTAFACEYPSDVDAVAAANLAMDSYHSLRDFRGLEAAGNRMLSVALPASVQGDIKAIIASSKNEELSEVIITSDTGDGDVVSRLLKVADDPTRQGTELAEKALVNAFSQAAQKRDLEDVNAIAAKILQRYPRSGAAANVLITLARFSSETGDFDAAASYYESMLERFPGDAKALEALDTAATLRQMIGDTARASADFEKLAAATKKSETVIRAAETRLSAGDNAGAEKMAELALKMDPASARAAAILGQSLLNQNRNPEAEKALLNAGKQVQKAAKSEPEDLARVYFLWGEAQFRQFKEVGPEELEKKAGMLQGLQQAYTSAAQLGGDWAVAGLFRLGQALSLLSEALTHMKEPPGLNEKQKGEFRVAIEQQATPLRTQADEVFSTCVKKARELEVYSPYALGCATKQDVNDKPQAVELRADLDPARVKTFRDLLARQPNDASALDGLGRAYLEAGDLRRARLVYARLLEVDENRAASHATLGFLLSRMGEPEQARQAY